MTRRGCLAAMIAMGLGPAVSAPLAVAGTPAPSIEIGVIHAQHTDGSAFIDPRLREIGQHLRDEPFVRYNVYRLLDHTRLPLEHGKPVALGLINGRTLKVTLVESKGSGVDRRYKMRAEIAEPHQEAFLKLLEVTAGVDEPFFVGGQSYDAGTLFLELVLRP
ncbi:MAG: hypothetical protein ABTD50_04385 [Polyangiaceae bacterium]